MKLSKFIALIAVSAIACSTAHARIISTFNAGGADAELRESAQTQNRGDSSEIASRVDAVSEVFPRNSVIYVKLPVGSITAEELDAPLVYRMTFRNSNLRPSRISNDAQSPLDADDGVPLHPEDYTGMDYWVLDPNNEGANWDESTIIPLNAPGYNWDGDMSTRAIVEGPGDFTSLGSQRFRQIPYAGIFDTNPEDIDWVAQENHLPVGEAMDIMFAPGSPLHQAIAAAQETDHETVTIASAVSHPADTEFAEWRGFNYLFNPKEKDVLELDPNYDNDILSGDGAEGSPWSGAINSIDTPFAPQILTASSIPEPSSVVLVGLAGLVGAAVFRRRK